MQEVETVGQFRELCLSLPETTETDSWGHPNFRAGKRTFATVEQFKDRPSFAFRLDEAEVNELLALQDFFITPYGRGRWVSCWVDGRIDWPLVEHLILRSYRGVALKRMLAALDALSE